MNSTIPPSLSTSTTSSGSSSSSSSVVTTFKGLDFRTRPNPGLTHGRSAKSTAKRPADDRPMMIPLDNAACCITTTATIQTPQLRPAVPETAEKTDDGPNEHHGCEEVAPWTLEGNSDGYETADDMEQSPDEAMADEIFSDDSWLGGMDKDVAAELLAWRRQSLFKVDFSDLFGTNKELWRGSELFQDFRNVVNHDQEKTKEELKEQKRFAVFDFSGWRLDDAFRELCSKIWISRKIHGLEDILKAFSYRYHECNPYEPLKDQECVLMVVQSLVFLDIELHVHQSVQMTCTLFCEWTMRKLCDTHGLSNDSTSGDEDDEDDMSGEMQEQMRSYLQELYFSVKQRSLFSVLLSRMNGDIAGRTSFPSGDTVSQKRRSSWTKLRPKYREKQGPYREGPLAFRKAEDDWQNRRIEIHLGHTLAQVDQKAGPHVFLLKLVNGLYLFDCGSERQMRLWIDQCNHWAALESKVPSLTERWPPSTPSAGPSILDQKEQSMAIRRYIAWLDDEYDRHFETLSSHEKTLLQMEQLRFLCYLDSLQRNTTTTIGAIME
ncbi:hypothetical protein EC973_004246 [Apophysomyces ossiformis]|uniref:SEC7 domain-containing protein n=1 Tax=Apophysomyces ossiformis TaxID=679940 RepID=A0A8H7BSM6_9FUNG|nr:hypothetical protein EC973_004246 [Apophysomyces ossiformis]